MSINIDSLSEEELLELNHKVVARIRFLREMRSHVQMLDFRIGERVRFQPSGRPEVFGTITRYNKKTVTVITDCGHHWNVAPGLLYKVKGGSEENEVKSNKTVVQFPGR
ncbi:MAG TPA: hypothetical protein VG759_28050 [Candidatus Angelobacter sp.]|jgi:hypothetical protein|nr:hypothetical protein [Candidatus Angelobacter sp.]